MGHVCGKYEWCNENEFTQLIYSVARALLKIHSVRRKVHQSLLLARFDLFIIAVGIMKQLGDVGVALACVQSCSWSNISCLIFLFQILGRLWVDFPKTLSELAYTHSRQLPFIPSPFSCVTGHQNIQNLLRCVLYAVSGYSWLWILVSVQRRIAEGHTGGTRNIVSFCRGSLTFEGYLTVSPWQGAG